MVFQGRFMVSHGFWLVAMLFQRSFIVFHGFHGSFTFFGSKEFSWILLLVNFPEMQKRSSRNTKMQKNKSFDSVVYITSTSTSTNISSAFAIDVSGCAHSHHG